MTLRAELVLRRAEFELSVSLDVPDGGVLAVLGPNGAGKSTVLACLAGLVRAERAHVRLGGRVLADGDAGVHLPAHRRGVGLLAQNALLFPHLSVLDNVAFSPRSRGASKAGARDVARRWLAEVEADDLADRTPAALSGGQAQRVLIARALAQRPRVLLLDEPTSALDLRYQVETLQGLRAFLREEGVAALIAIHDLNHAATFCQQVVLLSGGRLVADGPAPEAYDADLLGEVYGLPVEVLHDDGQTQVRPVLTQDALA